ncbi:CheW domain-containing protein [Pseudomonas sp. BBP2017]|uniref:CheW domain-containing protein n=1 Tax=Pseudomonas sp. BBP2017 TaxID=2109731 RepID=UPI000D117E25|nr:CheW domain-containing protein [Pseudomonas sp. BBP2017]PSS56396.1 chemotaxis protein CheW [Pseudomonas sp. BBP2017]
MNRPQKLATGPQLALQSYLDGLLHEATEVLELAEPSVEIDDFQAAVLEEQVRDAQVVRLHKPLAVQVAPLPFAEPALVVLPAVMSVVAPEPAPKPVSVEVVAELPAPVEPLVEVHLPPAPNQPVPPSTVDGRPAWAAEPFECLLFDVAGLTLAVPLVCLGSIYSLAGHELTPLFGQPDWFLGILPSQSGNLKVLDTARWVMPDRYREDFRQGLQYVISVQGYEWGLAVHQVSRSLRLDPNEIKWRSQRGQRPWLAGTVIEHMCALLDVAELAELIASGAVKQLHAKHN